MKRCYLGRLLLYYVPQGGAFAQANTIYFWPTLSLSQQKEAIDFEDGKKYNWLLVSTFLFWAVGAAW